MAKLLNSVMLSFNQIYLFHPIMQHIQQEKCCLFGLPTKCHARTDPTHGKLLYAAILRVQSGTCLNLCSFPTAFMQV